MARAFRVECPGAFSHVMARGDGGKRIFETRRSLRLAKEEATPLILRKVAEHALKQ